MDDRNLILIVEDDHVSRNILVNLFRDTYQIKEAENGLEALKILEQDAENISLIILDLLMPVMTGYEVLYRINQNELWKQIPVVVTTIEDTEESDLKLVDLGAFHIVHKPVHGNVLKKQLTNIVELYQKQKEIMKERTLQSALMNQTSNTFMCAYNFDSQSLEISENYQTFVEKDFVKVFDSYPFNMKDFVLPKDMKRLDAFLDIKQKSVTYEEIEVRLRIDEMHYKWFRISMLINADGEKHINSVYILFTDIQEAVEAKEKLTFYAKNDRVTHIPNMETFVTDVRAMLLGDPDSEFNMITMDIYQFQLVNKLFGYHEGNGVLKFFATKLQELIETFPEGAYCRMASDIFYACLPTSIDVQKFIDELQECLHSYPIKFDLKLCVGIYKIVNTFEDVESMIDHSAYARAEGKKLPGRPVQTFDVNLQKREYFEAVVISEMESALKSKQFEVYLQPKYDSVTEKVIGSEALIRWNHPEKGYMSPGLFIPVFERNGFVTELDYYVYEVVCQTIRNWIDQGKTPTPISVNVSRSDLHDLNLVEHISAIVEKYDVPHEYIEFEITESAFVLEKNLLTQFTGELRKRGFKVLIDDFGSGYSALNSLKDLIVDVLKIDIKFLPASSKELRAPVILKSVIEMAGNLGLDVIAEGVETQEQVKLLKDLHCEKIQGYYYARPMPISEFETMKER